MMLEDFQNNIPERTLKLYHIGKGGLFDSILVILVVFLGVIAVAYSIFTDTKDIIRDRQLIDNYYIVYTADIDGKCTIRKMVSDCNVTIVNNGQTIKRSFSFLDFSSSNDNDYEVKVIAQKDNPSNMTISLALDKMSSRISTTITMVIPLIILLYIGVSILRTTPEEQRLKKIMNDPNNQPWEFIEMPAILDGNTVRYTTEIDGKEIELEIGYNVCKPIIISQFAGTMQVVGIKARGENCRIIVSSEFKNIKLSKAEREVLLDIIDIHRPAHFASFSK